LVLLGYLDSLFAEDRAREVTPLRTLPATLNRLYAEAMREHARRSALLVREDAEWTPTPDWRLDRHVIRLGLYLRERLGVEPGHRVAVMAELRSEWLIADLASLGLGAVSVVIDPRLRGDGLLSALEDAAPRVTFISAAAAHMLKTGDGRGPPHGKLIALDSAVAGSGPMSLDALLELGGTLDTPERAQEYRAAARSVAPDSPAIRHYQLGPGGGWERVELGQGEVVERLRAGWLREPARPGDVAYVSDPTISPATRLALYAFLGDGYTTTALAAAGRELSDLAALHPTKIIVPAAPLEEAVRAGLARAEGRPSSDGGWLRHVSQLTPFAGARRERRAIRETLGGRARWIACTEPLDSALAIRLGDIADVRPAPN
jgi:hypothetical protein